MVKELGKFKSNGRVFRLIDREGEKEAKYYLPREILLQFLFKENPQVWLDVEFDQHEEIDLYDTIPTQHVVEMLKLISGRVQ